MGEAGIDEATSRVEITVEPVEDNRPRVGCEEHVDELVLGKARMNRKDLVGDTEFENAPEHLLLRLERWWIAHHEAAPDCGQRRVETHLAYPLCGSEVVAENAKLVICITTPGCLRMQAKP